jgi:hypothetical protein
MRAATANAFSFSTCDKRVDKTGQPGHWAKLEADLMVDYRERLGQLRSETQINEDSYIITPSNLSPLVYGQGKR